MDQKTVAGALAAGFLLLFAAVIGAAFWTGDKELARQLAQGLLTIVVGVAGFYFGSSIGSRNKDEEMARRLRQLPPASDPLQPGDAQ